MSDEEYATLEDASSYLQHCACTALYVPTE